MKNQHILTLKEVVPADIRLEVYKEAVVVIKNKAKIKKTGSVFGLCLILPCILWDLDHCLDNNPNDVKWYFEDTTIAFPEITQEFIDDIGEIGDMQTRIEFRLKLLTEAIENLTKTVLL